MATKRSISQISGKKSTVPEEEVIEPKQKKLFVPDPNKEYKMTAVQWAIRPYNLVIFELCDPCLQNFRDCRGSPNIMLLACDDCTLRAHRSRFPQSDPLKPLPPSQFFQSRSGLGKKETSE